VKSAAVDIGQRRGRQPSAAAPERASASVSRRRHASAQGIYRGWPKERARVCPRDTSQTTGPAQPPPRVNARTFAPSSPCYLMPARSHMPSSASLLHEAPAMPCPRAAR